MIKVEPPVGICIIGTAYSHNDGDKKIRQVLEQIRDDITTRLQDGLTCNDIEVQIATTPPPEPVHEPTPEQLAEMQAADEEKWKRLDEQILRERNAKYNREYEVAEHWGNRTDLTKQEIAHGVVWGIHNLSDSYTRQGRQRFEENVRAKYPEKIAQQMIDRIGPLSLFAPEYAAVYEHNKAEEIKSGLVRSAASLFT